MRYVEYVYVFFFFNEMGSVVQNIIKHLVVYNKMTGA